MLVGFHRDALHIDLGPRGVLVIKRLLSFLIAAGFFSHNARLGVARLMQVQIFKACGCPILFQVIGKGSGAELNAGFSSCTSSDRLLKLFTSFAKVQRLM
jgi:hypothetical protein